ncbi:MAG: dockerin type I domain-containing protein [Chloroflexota bacterium]|nr:dockerin type I domain-containing protein [Chloroflexota bacterium]
MLKTRSRFVWVGLLSTVLLLGVIGMLVGVEAAPLDGLQPLTTEESSATPTATPSRTPTSAPIGVTLRVNAGMQGRPPQPHPRYGIPVSVRIANNFGIVLFDGVVNTDENGGGSVTAPFIPPGTYRARAKGEHTLAIAVEVVLTGANQTIEAGTLREGDANNDNSVNINDFSILAASFGKSSGIDGFDPRADFNMDGTVNISDFSLLAGNFGMTGAA